MDETAKIVETAARPAGLRGNAVRTLLLGGVLPVVAFAVVEELWGAKAGLVAGMAFGVGEIIWEWRTLKRVQAVTWIGNGLLLGLGVVSIVSDDGYWFKLQPAFLEGAMTIALVGSHMLGRPLLTMLARKQMPPESLVPEVRTVMEKALRGMNLRMGLFFALQTALAVWSALAWTTAAWALLKGVGFTGSMIAYTGAEILWMRRQVRHSGKVP